VANKEKGGEKLVEELIKRFKKFVKDKKNVLGVEEELVPREKGGRFYKKQKVLRVYVVKKEPLESLAVENRIPEEFEGIPTDVVEIGELKALSDPKKRHRPFPAGVSAINYKGTACTLGWFAIDEVDGSLVIIANNHCTARENKASIGEAYWQPSPNDGGTPEDKIGELKRFIPIEYEEYYCPFRSIFGLRNWWRKQSPQLNKVDLGIVKITVYQQLLEILDIGKVYDKGDPVIDERVQKTGRTTGHTTGGRIIGTSFTGSVQYGRGSAVFTDCAIIQKDNFSAGGDSSSAIVTTHSRPRFRGLLFAGSDTHTILCKTGNIEALGRLKVYHESIPIP